MDNLPPAKRAALYKQRAAVARGEKSGGVLIWMMGAVLALLAVVFIGNAVSGRNTASTVAASDSVGKVTSSTPSVIPLVVPSPTTSNLAPTATGAPETTPKIEFAQVANTEGEGVYIRSTPILADRLRAYADGTQLAIVGPDVDGDGQTWHHIQAPDGSEGYVPAMYTSPAQPIAVASVAIPTQPTAVATAPPIETATIGALRPTDAPTAPNQSVAVPTQTVDRSTDLSQQRSADLSRQRILQLSPQRISDLSQQRIICAVGYALKDHSVVLRAAGYPSSVIIEDVNGGCRSLVKGGDWFGLDANADFIDSMNRLCIMNYGGARSIVAYSMSDALSTGSGKSICELADKQTPGSVDFLY